MTTTLFFALAGVSIIPILVTIFLPKEKSFFEKSTVRGFGLGVYLMLVVVLLKEAVSEGGIVTSSIWFAGGFLLSLLIGLVLKEFHHHHTEEERLHSHNVTSTYRILISDFFHNIVDGIAIITGFILSPAIGMTSFLGVLGHQIIQQTGQQILLVESGTTPKKAIVISFIISLSIFLGFFLTDNESLEIIFIALSAGIVVWKVAKDLIHEKWNKKTIIGFMFGALILAITLLAVPHTHDHGHEEESEAHIGKLE